MAPSSRRILLSLFLIAGLFFAMGTGPLDEQAEQAELERKMKELDEINAIIEKYEKMHEQKKTEERQVLNQIRTLEKNIDTLETDITVLMGSLSKTEEEIAGANREIDSTVGLINERTAYFNTRLRQMYLDGDVNYLEILVRSTSLTDFLTRFDLLQKIAEYDTRLLRELDNDRKSLVLKKMELEDKAEHFNNMKTQKEQKQQQLEIQSGQKGAYLKTIQEQKEEYTKTIAELDEVRKVIDQFIREWQEKHQQAYMGSGKMQWPLPGYSHISSGYGYRTHPTLKVRSFHAAIDIPAPAGTPVLAAERGKVLYMGIKGGYGKAIILDHGGNISTQYSHLSKYLPGLKVGDMVKRGQAIGYAGSTGWSTGPHLDFIVRLKGEPQNPRQYVSP